MAQYMKLLLIGAAAVLLYAGTVNAYLDFSVTSNISQMDWQDLSLTTHRFAPGHFQSRLSLANGYVGAALAASGPFFEADVNFTDPNGTPPLNGWPLDNRRQTFATISGFFDVQENASRTNYEWIQQYGWDSFISGIPHPSAIIYGFGDDYLDATVSNSSISNFSSKISFWTGIPEWAYTWSPRSCGVDFSTYHSLIISRRRPNVIAVKTSITPSEDISGTITDLLDGRSAQRAHLNLKGLDAYSNTIFTSVHPDNLPGTTGWLVSGTNFTNGYTNLSSRVIAAEHFGSDESTIGQTYMLDLKKGETATFYKYVGIASTDKFKNAEATARECQELAEQDGWDALAAEHSEDWGKMMAGSFDDFRDPVTGLFPNEMAEIFQMSSVTNAFFLSQNLQPEGSGLNDESISVSGLTSDSYGGQRFWDSDFFMAPALNLGLPRWSRQISNLRLKQFPQALANAAFNNFPNGSALFPWTAGRYGNCTATGPCVDYQYHLNVDIALNLLQEYNINQNKTWFDAAAGPREVIHSVAKAMSHLLTWNGTTNGYESMYFLNSQFVLQAVLLGVERGEPVNETWLSQADNIKIAVSEFGITEEFDTMNNTAPVKQADVVLLAYPLGYSQDYTVEQKLRDQEYYGERQSPDGPAMTFSTFAIGANELSLSGCSAFTYTQASLLPYLRAPFYQFSEQVLDDPAINGNTKPAFPFLTGHGGAMQIVPFGFLGVRTTEPVLHISPSLPPQIPHLRVRNFFFGGSRFSAVMNSTHTNLTRLSTPADAGVVDVYAHRTIPFVLGTPNSGTPGTNYTIAINQTITVPNRMYWQNKTVSGNLVQCLAVTSEDAYVPGQFPVAAIDGAISTRWQPAQNESAAIFIDTQSAPASLVSSIQFDWGRRPARRAVVSFGNYTNGIAQTGSEVQIEITGIAPNEPFDAAATLANVLVIAPDKSNTTTFDIVGGTWSGDYVRLEIEGCWEEDGKGATVGEFVPRSLT
ncbi:glycosyl hydrolase family 65 protein [Diplocarpon rosae]|nr:glycosyl hydrolase family 65 protein [Diplocarpon rosae]